MMTKCLAGTNLTLSLATKQLDRAERLDPDAVLELDIEGSILRLTIPELKAQALLQEGIAHQAYDTKRALPPLRRATKLDPDNPAAHFVLGLLHAANMNKSAAIAAFERAVELDPTNLSYRKELDRAQNLGLAEVAAYKVTRAGERTFDAAIFSWNIFALIWNIFVIIWYVLTFPLRLFFKVGRFIGAL